MQTTGNDNSAGGVKTICLREIRSGLFLVYLASPWGEQINLTLCFFPQEQQGTKTSKKCGGMREQTAGEQEQKCPGRCRRGQEAGMTGRMHSQHTCGSYTHLLFLIKSLAAPRMCLGLFDLTK